MSIRKRERTDFTNYTTNNKKNTLKMLKNMNRKLHVYLT